MSDKPINPPLFQWWHGSSIDSPSVLLTQITLRDLFAAVALHAILSRPSALNDPEFDIAAAYVRADLALTWREKK